MRPGVTLSAGRALAAGSNRGSSRRRADGDRDIYGLLMRMRYLVSSWARRLVRIKTEARCASVPRRSFREGG